MRIYYHSNSVFNYKNTKLLNWDPKLHLSCLATTTAGTTSRKSTWNFQFMTMVSNCKHENHKRGKFCELLLTMVIRPKIAQCPWPTATTRSTTIWTTSWTASRASTTRTTIPFLARARSLFILIRFLHLYKDLLIVDISKHSASTLMIWKHQGLSWSAYRKHCYKEQSYRVHNGPEEIRYYTQPPYRPLWLHNTCSHYSKFHAIINRS